MNPFVNPKKRSLSLPSGCKDLADVLESPKRNKFYPVRQFLTLVLMEAYQASQIVIGPEPEIGELPKIKYKIRENWNEIPYASEFRQSLIAEVQHMAGLPSSRFPSEGTLSLLLETVRLRWKVRIPSRDSECTLTDSNMRRKVPNQCVQVTPDYAFCEFLRRGPGAASPLRIRALRAQLASRSGMVRAGVDSMSLRWSFGK